MADRPDITTLPAGAKYDTETLNGNFAALREAFDGILGTIGTAGDNNTMSGDLDMDGNSIRNADIQYDSIGTSFADLVDAADASADSAAASAVLADASSDSAAASAVAAAASALAAAAYASPTTQNLTTGVGFTAGSSTTITLTTAVVSEDQIDITFDGVRQHHNTYTVSGTTVTFDAAIPTGTVNIEVRSATLHDLGTPSDATVTTAKLADSSVTAAKLGPLAVTTAKINTGAVDSAALGDSSVVTIKIANASVTTSKLGNITPGTNKYLYMSDSNTWALADKTGSGSVVLADGPTLSSIILDQGAVDTMIAVARSSDVASGLTSAAFVTTTTNDYFLFGKESATTGGVVLTGIAESTTGQDAAFTIRGFGGYVNTSFGASNYGMLNFEAYEHTGSNALQNATSGALIASFAARVGGGRSSVWQLSKEGNTWQTGTATIGGPLTVTGTNNNGINIRNDSTQFTALTWANGVTEKAVAFWDNSGSKLTIATEVVGASLVLKGDNSVIGLTLSGASGSELATFAKAVTIAGALSGVTTLAASGVITETITQNAETKLRVINSSNGTGAVSLFEATNDTPSAMQVGITGSGNTFGGQQPAGAAFFSGNAANGISIFASHASGAVRIYAGGSSVVGTFASTGLALNTLALSGVTTITASGIISTTGTSVQVNAGGSNNGFVSINGTTAGYSGYLSLQRNSMEDAVLGAVNTNFGTGIGSVADLAIYVTGGGRAIRFGYDSTHLVASITTAGLVMNSLAISGVNGFTQSGGTFSLSGATNTVNSDAAAVATNSVSINVGGTVYKFLVKT